MQLQLTNLFFKNAKALASASSSTFWWIATKARLLGSIRVELGGREGDFSRMTYCNPTPAVGG